MQNLRDTTPARPCCTPRHPAPSWEVRSRPARHPALAGRPQRPRPGGTRLREVPGRPSGVAPHGARWRTGSGGSSRGAKAPLQQVSRGVLPATRPLSPHPAAPRPPSPHPGPPPARSPHPGPPPEPSPHPAAPRPPSPRPLPQQDRPAGPALLHASTPGTTAGSAVPTGPTSGPGRTPAATEARRDPLAGGPWATERSGASRSEVEDRERGVVQGGEGPPSRVPKGVLPATRPPSPHPAAPRPPSPHPGPPPARSPHPAAPPGRCLRLRGTTRPLSPHPRRHD
jgi:hypothetical protein